MQIDLSTIKILIYLALACYAASTIFFTAKNKNAGRHLLASAFAAAAAAFIFRWITVKHIPMQNLFEVFLTLGFLLYPIAFFTKRLLAIPINIADSLLGFIILFPAGFIFSSQPKLLPPALQSWLFGPHVAVYMLSYLLLAKAAWLAFLQLKSNKHRENTINLNHEKNAYTLTCAAFPLLTAGLLLGCFWAKIAWGDYWDWDPKELWSLATWLVFVGYFHFRYKNGTKSTRANSIWIITGFIFIIITLLWVNLSRIFAGLHSYA